MADLEGIVASAMNAADSGGTPDTGADITSSADAPVEVAETTDAPTTEEAAPVVEGTEPPAAQTPAEEEVPELSAQELAGQTLPVSRHKAVLTKARRDADRRVAEVQEKLARYEAPEVQEKLTAIDVADQNPGLFAQVLAEDPRFRPHFEKLFGGAAPEPQAGKPTAPAANAADRPQPDALMADGTVGFSADATERLVDWALKRQSGELNQQFTKLMDERFGEVSPLVERHKAEQAWNEALAAQRPVLDKARKSWPKFVEHEKDIRAFINAPGNETATLHDAYVAVVIPKMQSNEDAMRARILAELNGKPAAALKGPQPIPRPASAGPKTTEDVVREAIERAESRAESRAA